MTIITKVPFVSALVHIVVNIKFRPQNPRGIDFVSVHEKMPKEVNNFFVNWPLDLGGGGSDPLGPPKSPRYFGLQMVNLSRPPLPPNMPYHLPFHYLEYVKDLDPDVHVGVFKVAIRANGEIEDAKIINLFSFTFKDIVFDRCNNYMGDYPIVFLHNCS
jgi:hypothetical protein